MASHKKRILIADPSSTSIRTIFEDARAADYEIQTADTASSVLSLVSTFKPHLLFVELLLPEMHGIGVLKKIRENKKSKDIGVVIMSSMTMIQNYNAAVALDANEFLIKPFAADRFYEIIKQFFEGHLEPSSFESKVPQYDLGACYKPALSTASSYLKFWGTRGSSPVSGPEYVKYGGNTACLEIRSGDHHLIIDAGSGIRDLGAHMPEKMTKNIHLIIGHAHLDHITGFPFFDPLYHSDCTITVWSPLGYEKSTQELFQDLLSFGCFPIRLEELQAELIFKELNDHSSIQIGDLVIDAHHTQHPGPTLGFRIKSPKQTIGYITDNEMLLGYHGHPRNIEKSHSLLEPHLSLIEFLSDCNIIIHEAQYFTHEYHERVGWGHSSIANATALIAQLKNCQEWIVTHHDPKHSDNDLAKKMRLHLDVLNECSLDCHFRMAYDGLVIPI